MPDALSNPYRGLRPYGLADADRFHGRRRLTQRVIERLQGGAKKLLLTGPCGSGKTSLIMAGLLPSLGSLSMHGVVIAHPGLDPFEQLARQGLSGAAEDLLGALRAKAGSEKTLLFIDHAEELAAAELGLAQRNLLQQLAQGFGGADRGPEPTVLIAVRTDCLDALSGAAPQLVPWLDAPTVYVPAGLELSEWMAIVREPARAAGRDVEAALISAIGSDLAALTQEVSERGAAVLPHLSFVLHALWQQGQEGSLRCADYQQLGGLRHSLQRWADAAWASLPSHSAARRALLPLLSIVGRSERGLLLARPLSLAAWRLHEATASSSLEATSAAGLAALLDSGLIHIDETQDSVELVHSVLSETWPQLAQMHRDEQRFATWHRSMTTLVLPRPDADGMAARPTSVASSPAPASGQVSSEAAQPAVPASTLSGTQLAEAERWLGERPGEIDGAVRQLIEDCRQNRSSRQQALRSRPPGTLGPLPRPGLPWPLALGAGLVLVLLGLAAQRFVHYRELRGRDFDLATERGARASLLVMQPGQDGTALALAIKAVAPALRAGRPVPLLAKEGLMTAYSLARNSQPLHGHTDRVDSAVFDPSGSLVLTASTDRTARIWDARTGRQLLTFSGHRQMLTSASFSANGQTVLTTSADGTARLWEVSSGRLLHELVGHGVAVENGQFSPNGSAVVTAGHDGAARIWDVQSGRLLHTLAGHRDRVTTATFSRDGRRILTASWDRSARIWDAGSGRLLRVLVGHNARLYLAAFTADGQRVATAGWDQSVRLWNVAEAPTAPDTGPPPLGPDGAQLAETMQVGESPPAVLPHEELIQVLVFSPDGAWLATAGANGMLKLWDARSGTLKAKLGGHYGSVYGLDFASDSKHFVSAGSDRTVRLWNVGVERAVAVLYGHSSHIYTAAFSPSGDRVVTASYDQTARIWDVRAGQPVAILQGHRRGVTSASFSRQGTRIITSSEDHTARLWAWPGGALIRELRDHTNLVNMAAFSPDGSLVATASSDYDVRLWDGQSGQPLRVLHGHAGPVFAVAFSPDGDRLVSAGFDHVLRFWDPKTGAQTAEVPGHSGNANWLAFSPDGKLMVSTGSEGETWIRDGRTGAALRSLRGHSGRVNRAEFFVPTGAAPGELRVVTASSDRSVRIWDPQTGSALNVLAGFADDVTSVAPSPDGRRLLVTSGEQGVRLWDVAAEMPLAVLPGFFEESVTASYGMPDGRHFIIASSDGLTKVYTDDYPANLAGTLSNACELLRYQRDFERVREDCLGN